MTEHLCTCCPQLRPGDPRVYERPMVCGGCRSRLRSLLAELVDTYAQLCADPTVNAGEWVDERGKVHLDPVAYQLPAGASRGRGGQAPISGSRTPPLPLSVADLDLTLPPHGGVQDDLVPLYEAVEVEVTVWSRPVLPGDEYGTETVTMRQARRARVNGWKAYGPSGDQVGDLSVPAVLDSWARDWQTYAWALLPEPTVSSLTQWLSERLEWACDSHPAVDDFAWELRELASRVRSAAGLTRPKAELKLGVPCRECERVTLYRWPGSDYVECGSCPVLMTAEEYTRWTQLIGAPEWRSWVEEIAERTAS